MVKEFLNFFKSQIGTTTFKRTATTMARGGLSINTYSEFTTNVLFSDTKTFRQMSITKLLTSTSLNFITLALQLR